MLKNFGYDSSIALDSRRMFLQNCYVYIILIRVARFQTISILLFLKEKVPLLFILMILS